MVLMPPRLSGGVGMSWFIWDIARVCEWVFMLQESKSHKNKVRFPDETLTDSVLQSLPMMPTLLQRVSRSGVEVVPYSGAQRCSMCLRGGPISSSSCSQGKGMCQEESRFP